MPVRPADADPDQLERWTRIRQRVGAQVRRIRTGRGITQETLALESGLSRNQLIALEHGRRSVMFERLQDLADALDVPVGTFFEAP